MAANAVPTAGSYPKRHTKKEAKVIETARQSLGASDLIKQTITTGVTTSAPSQSAVYDALALKQSTSGLSAAVIAIMIKSGTAAPEILPDFVGQLYVKTDTGKIYCAIALVAEANSWAILN